MHPVVSVVFSANQEYRFDLGAAEPLSNEAARRWLDEEFVRLDCEPLRPSGKVLIADKVLTVAQAAGTKGFDDAAWAQQFARAASAALARPLVRIDVPTMAISY